MKSWLEPTIEREKSSYSNTAGMSERDEIFHEPGKNRTGEWPTPLNENEDYKNQGKEKFKEESAASTKYIELK